MTDLRDYKDRIQVAFDNLATQGFVGTGDLEYAKQLLAGLILPKNPTVLDLGCGTGAVTFALMKKTRGRGSFFGIDFSRESISLAKEKAVHLGFGNVDFKTADIECKLDFEDSTFDIVISNKVFHWVKNKQQTLTETYRVLKPAGQLAMAFQGKPSYRELFDAYDRVRQRHSEYNLLQRPPGLSIEETLNLFREAQFINSRLYAIEEVTFLPPALFFGNQDLESSPWKIGLSKETAEAAQKEIAFELLKIKPVNPLQTTTYTIYGLWKK
jgi:ubiquinone/menaquinone biosynthesis C-methylase UbiE